MRSAMAQEAFMNWDQIQVSWKQLKEKFVLQWFSVTDDKGKSFSKNASTRRCRGTAEATRKRPPFNPTTAEGGSQFSLHIGS